MLLYPCKHGAVASLLYHVVCYCSFIPLSTHIFSVATLELFIWPLQWGKSPRHSSQHNLEQQCYLHELATPIVSSRFPPHCSTLYPTPVIRGTRLSVYNEPKMSTYPCYNPPQTPACTFALDALTSSPGIFYETLMRHATRSGSPHNALHSPSFTLFKPVGTHSGGIGNSN